MRLGQILWIDYRRAEGVLEDVRTSEQFRFSTPILFKDGQLVNFGVLYNDAVFISAYDSTNFVECPETLANLIDEVALGKRMLISMEQE